MVLSIIITALLLYVAFRTKMNNSGLPNWIFYAIALIALASWESAVVMLGMCIYCLYKGVKSGEISTLNWIESLIKLV